MKIQGEGRVTPRGATFWTKVVNAGLRHLKSAVAPVGTHPPDMHPEPALAATRRTAKAQGGAERSPGSPHPMTPRPNGAKGDSRTLFRVPFQGTEDVVWRGARGSTPGFHRLPLRGTSTVCRRCSRGQPGVRNGELESRNLGRPAGWGHPAFSFRTGTRRVRAPALHVETENLGLLSQNPSSS